MTEFDPGKGWQEATAEEALNSPERIMHYDPVRRGAFWIPVSPIEPLPTVAMTMIMPRWSADWSGNRRDPVWLDADGKWALNAMRYTPDELLERIQGWDLLSEPLAAIGSVDTIRRRAVREALGRISLLTSGPSGSTYVSALSRVKRELG